MNSKQENRFGMLTGVHSYYVKHSAFFNPIAHYPPLITGLKNILDSIIKQAGISTEDITGYTETKSASRKKLEKISGKVANALMPYCIYANLEPVIEPGDYLPSALSTATDSDLYVLARQLFNHAEPVKNLLPPYGSGHVDVALLNTTAENFLPQIKVARNKRRERSRSVKKLADIFLQADELLVKFDNNMAVYQYIQLDLWTAYKLSRKITDNASGHTVHKKRGQVLPGFVAGIPFSREVLKATSKLVLSNTGKTGELVFYFSSQAGVRPLSETKLNKVQHNKTLKTTATEAGYTVQTPFLNVLNPNVRHGQWKAVIE